MVTKSEFIQCFFVIYIGDYVQAITFVTIIFELLVEEEASIGKFAILD